MLGVLPRELLEIIAFELDYTDLQHYFVLNKRFRLLRTKNFWRQLINPSDLTWLQSEQYEQWVTQSYLRKLDDRHLNLFLEWDSYMESNSSQISKLECAINLEQDSIEKNRLRGSQRVLIDERCHRENVYRTESKHLQKRSELLHQHIKDKFENPITIPTIRKYVQIISHDVMYSYSHNLRREDYLSDIKIMPGLLVGNYREKPTKTSQAPDQMIYHYYIPNYRCDIYSRSSHKCSNDQYYIDELNEDMVENSLSDEDLQRIYCLPFACVIR